MTASEIEKTAAHWAKQDNAVGDLARDYRRLQGEVGRLTEQLHESVERWKVDTCKYLDQLDAARERIEALEGALREMLQWDSAVLPTPLYVVRDARALLTTTPKP